MGVSTYNATGISTCVLCDQELPRLLLGCGPASRLWECRSCGASFEGVLAEDANKDLLSRIAVTDYFPEHQ